MAFAKMGLAVAFLAGCLVLGLQAERSEEESLGFLGQQDALSAADLTLTRTIREAKRNGDEKKKKKNKNRKNRPSKKSLKGKKKKNKRPSKKSNKGKSGKKKGGGKKKGDGKKKVGAKRPKKKTKKVRSNKNKTGKKKGGGKKKKGDKRPKKKSNKAKNGKKNNKKNKKPVRPGKKSNKIKGRQDAACAVTDECLEKMSVMGWWYGNRARNIFRMSARALDKSGMTKKKKEKKADFDGVMADVEGVSGDCQSKLSGNGTNFNDTLTKLKACNAAIDTACDGGMDNDTMAKMTGCKEAAEAFRTGFLAMTNADADKMCAMLGDVEALKTAAETACENVEDVDKAQVDKQKMCKEAFMDCAKARKDSVDIVVKCGSACPVPDTNTSPAPTGPAADTTPAIVPTTTGPVTTQPPTTTTATTTITTKAANTTATAASTTTVVATTTTNTNATSAAFKCGVKNSKNKIVGGTETEVFEWPWITWLMEGALLDQPITCGGTLVGVQWVVSAAHCTYRFPNTNPQLAVLLGEHDRTQANEAGSKSKLFKVLQVINHPGFGFENDISLLRIENVDLRVYTPACLPNLNQDFTGQTAWAYGWGTTSYGGSLSDVLLEIELKVVSKTECKAAMGESSIVDGMVCAGATSKDTCQGDSGGPLTAGNADGQHTLVGATSFGDKCALPNKFGVYADVGYYRTWMVLQFKANGGINTEPI